VRHRQSVIMAALSTLDAPGTSSRCSSGLAPVSPILVTDGVSRDLGEPTMPIAGVRSSVRQMKARGASHRP
jgi:hypothetical protein